MKLKKLFKRRGSWCKGCAAKDKSGKDCSIFSRKAVRFCVSGAIARYQSDNFFETYRKIKEYLGIPIDSSNLDVLVWNDKTNFQAVRKMCEVLDI